MKSLPEYRLAIQLSGPQIVTYRYPELIQTMLFSQFFYGTAIGAKTHNDRFSLFTYSLLANDPMFTKDGFISKDGNWTFRFASTYRDLLVLIEHALNTPTVELFEEHTFKVKGVYKEPLMERNIFQSEPIFMTDKQKNLLDPTDEEYYHGIKNGLYNRYEFFYNKRPNENAIKSIKFTQTPRKKLIPYKGRKLLSFTGGIKLQGDADVIKFAQCVGLGQMTSAGLGMLI